ncbi:MAG: hypothetical protein H0W18_15500 [Acidobacteria bacterium]|nr:hypothetical protein [Acidobacteriota bacterium]
MDATTAERRRRMTVRRFASHAEADAADLAYWRAIPDAERVLQVWRLSLAQWTMKGDVDDASRLRRSITRIRRG